MSKGARGQCPLVWGLLASFWVMWAPLATLLGLPSIITLIRLRQSQVSSHLSWILHLLSLAGVWRMCSASSAFTWRAVASV